MLLLIKTVVGNKNFNYQDRSLKSLAQQTSAFSYFKRPFYAFN